MAPVADRRRRCDNLVAMAQEQRRLIDYLSFQDERPFINKAFEHELADEDRILYA
jgi:hypothetical protein